MSRSSEDALSSWREEKQSAFLYRQLARVEAAGPRQKLFRSLAEVADRQAGIWERQLGAMREFSPGIRARIVAGMLLVFGPERMLSVLAAMKVRGLSVYSVHEIPSADSLAEKRHRGSSSGGNLRAAVFGANDGLLSNASLILGVAGGVHAASAGPSVVVISGIAGLLAGAFSMASGEFVSVRSQRELYEYQIALEREELHQYPFEEAMELALIYEAKGIAPEDARRMADQIVADPVRALDTLAREELGLNPRELGSPVEAAVSSFLSFFLGALIPLFPFLVFRGGNPLWAAMALTALALFLMGCVLSLFTGKRAVWGGVRMVLIGLVVGTLTYGIGVGVGGLLRGDLILHTSDTEAVRSPEKTSQHEPGVRSLGSGSGKMRQLRICLRS